MVIRDEDHCYVCGDRVPRNNRSKAAVERRPVSGMTNVVFLASLAFTAYCFFGAHKLTLPMTIAVSSTLLLLRILAEHLANRNSN
ncbi:MAG: hypothetical protein ACLPWF_28710 [Bryobacteraceae bacterium]